MSEFDTVFTITASVSTDDEGVAEYVQVTCNGSVLDPSTARAIAAQAAADITCCDIDPNVFAVTDIRYKSTTNLADIMNTGMKISDIISSSTHKIVWFD